MPMENYRGHPQAPGVEGGGSPGLLPKGAVLDRPVALLSFLGKGDPTGLLYLDLTGFHTLSACVSGEDFCRGAGGGGKGHCWAD